MNLTKVRPLPSQFVEITTDQWTEPYWDAAKRGELVAQACKKCGQFRMPPGPFCPNCQSQECHYPVLSGRGIVFSYSVCHKAPVRDGTPDFTYVPAIIEIPDAGGVRLVSNVVEIAPEDVMIGMEVEVTFAPSKDPEWLVPVFRPRTK